MCRFIFVLIVLSASGCGSSANNERQDAPFVQQVTADTALTSSADGVLAEDPSRKVVYESKASIETTEFSEFQQSIARVVKEHGGYLSHIFLQRRSGKSMCGDWTARIPVDRYDAFVERLHEFGETTSFSQSANEVTQEFTDLESRVFNQKRIESRILDIIGQSTTDLRNTIELERELSRVREGIETMQGRIRLLTNRVAMAAVSIHVIETLPDVHSLVLAFGTRVHQAWQGAIGDVRTGTENVIVFAVAFIPRVIIPALLAGLCFVIYRVRRR